MALVIFLSNGDGLSLDLNPLIEVSLLVQIICEHLKISNNGELFTLWLISPLLEIQLKPYHIPLTIRSNWEYLLKKYTNNISQELSILDEPNLIFKRNIYNEFTIEKDIVDINVLRLLYEDTIDSFSKLFYKIDHDLIIKITSTIISIQLYNKNILAENNDNVHLTKMKFWKVIPANLWNYIEFNFIPKRKWKNIFATPADSNIMKEIIFEAQKNYKREHDPPNIIDLYKEFLFLCHSLPSYASVSFDGFIQTNFLNELNKDKLYHILVTINIQCLTVIDITRNEILLSLNYDDFSWDLCEMDKPYLIDKKMPSILLQVNNEVTPTFCRLNETFCQTKIFVLYSKQAPLMDALIESVVRIKEKNLSLDVPDHSNTDGESLNFYKICIYSMELNKFECYDVDSKGDITEVKR
ncbi:FERM domain-containing protein 8-like isoform X1 [Gordionus sp. m RMFG-2023]|uniref:FERM domain-containing protein 8-like isoform X1 n=1 Tax=Gordionus sp. m RMFG-2023 TaxID=3053472 RepID=UPI0031FC9857